MNALAKLALVLVPVFLPAGSQAPAAGGRVSNTSAYTTLDDKACKTLSHEDEGAASTQLCPGYGGYKLRVLDEDARESITVVTPDGQRHPLEFSQSVTPAFSSLGPRAEWRLRRAGAVSRPVALTVRLNASEDSANPAAHVSYLVVTRLDPQHVCVVKVIKSSASALDEARQVADLAGDLPCLKGG